MSAAADRRKESEESKQEQLFQAQDRVAQIGRLIAAVLKKIAGWDIPRNKSQARTVE